MCGGSALWRPTAGTGSLLPTVGMFMRSSGRSFVTWFCLLWKRYGNQTAVCTEGTDIPDILSVNRCCQNIAVNNLKGSCHCGWDWKMTGEALTQELNSFTEDTVSLIRHDGVEQVWLTCFAELSAQIISRVFSKNWVRIFPSAGVDLVEKLIARLCPLSAFYVCMENI